MSLFFYRIMRILSQKRHIFTYFNVKMHPLPFISPTFSQIIVLKKNAEQE